MPTTFHRRSGGDRTPRDHYAEVTAQIIAALEAGTPPWRQPWDNAKAGGPPQNAVSRDRYRGINTVILGMSLLAFTSGDPRWATYKQAAERGWQIRKGSRGTTAFFYKRIEIGDQDGDSDGERRMIPMLRAFTLFHATQIEGIPEYVAPDREEAPWREPEAAQIIARNSGAEIRIGGERAFYSPHTDHIQLPPLSAFRSPAAFASVQLHEQAHWSSAAPRLNRDIVNRFGSHDYAREELRAELAQVMICSELGIEDCDFTNSAAYIAHWLARLKDDRREIFRAAADAQRIADYLLAFHPDYASKQCAKAQQEPPAGRSTESGAVLPEAA